MLSCVKQNMKKLHFPKTSIIILLETKYIFLVQFIFVFDKVIIIIIDFS